MCEAYQYLPDGWYAPKLAELGNISTGTTPPTSDPSNYGGDLPFVGPSDLGSKRWIDSCSETLSRKGQLLSRTVEKNAVLVSCIGILGKLGQAKERLSFNQQINSIQPAEEKIDAGFLYFSASRLQSELNKLAGLQVVPIVNKGLFSNLRISAPKRLVEQRLIAHILDTLDTQIQKTEALIAKLEKVKEGLLHDLLTRGIDENGQLRPSPEQAPELYKESPLGLIPREWNPKTIGDLSSSIVDGPFGSNLKTEHYVTDPGVRVVRLQNITPFEYDDTDRAFIKDGHAEALSKNTVQPEDVLIASLGDGTHPAGRACLYPYNLPEAINKADCFRLRADSRVVINTYIMLFMNSDLFAKQARRWTQGVTLQRINTTSLKRINIPCPPLEEQKLICRKVNNALFLLATKREELGKLVLKKQGLMDDLLTGRVRVTPLLEQAQATTPA